MKERQDEVDFAESEMAVRTQETRSFYGPQSPEVNKAFLDAYHKAKAVIFSWGGDAVCVLKEGRDGSNPEEDYLLMGGENFHTILGIPQSNTRGTIEALLRSGKELTVINAPQEKYPTQEDLDAFIETVRQSL
jgi:hypothetical protein